MDAKIIRPYELSVWTLQDSFLTVLKSIGATHKGEVVNPKCSIKTDGTQTLSFSIPIKYWDGKEWIINPLWYNTTNGNLLVNLRKLKLIFNKGEDEEKVFEFVITKINETNSNNQPACEVEAEGLAFNELGQIGYKIALSQELFEKEYNEWFEDPNREEAEEFIASLNYWADKVFKNSNWDYSIEMDWSAQDGAFVSNYSKLSQEEKDQINDFRESQAMRRMDRIYENEFISSWKQVDNTLSPASLESFKEKARMISADKGNIYNITQTLAETFGVFCKYQYEYDDNYHIIGRKCIFYNTFLDEQEAPFDINYSRNADKIERTIESEDVITKMYVTPIEDDSTYSGYITIMDVAANKSGEDYILNFDYLYATGAITEEQYAAINDYEIQMYIYNKELLPVSQELDDLALELVELNAQKTLLSDSIVQAEEQMVAAQAKLEAIIGSSPLSKSAANPDIGIFIADGNTYYINVTQEGVDINTIQVYKTYSGGILSEPYNLSQVNFDVDEFGNLYRLSNFNITFEATESKRCYLTYNYMPKNKYQNIYTTYSNRLNNDHNSLDIVNSNIEAKTERQTLLEERYATILTEKEQAIANFNRMMGPALKERPWQSDTYNDYGSYYTEVVKNDGTGTQHYLSLVNDIVPFEEEQLPYYLYGINQDKIYYYAINLASFGYDISNHLDDLRLYYDKIIGGQAVTQSLAIGSKLQYGFCRDSNSYIFGTLIVTDENVELSDLQRNTKIGYTTTDFEDDEVVVNFNEIGPVSVNDWIDLEEYDFIYFRIKIGSTLVKLTDDTLTIWDENSDKFLTKYYDYTILFRDGFPYITIKNNIAMLSPNNVHYEISFILSNAAQSLYLDALEVSKTNAFPQVSYSTNLVPYDESFLKQGYDKLGKLANINDVDLHLQNIKGYISEIELDLNAPWKDNYTIQNYKTKFEDLFSKIVASSEQMKVNAFIYDRAAGAFNSTGALREENIQNTLDQSNLRYSFLNGTLTIDEMNGIWAQSDTGVVAYRGGGIFCARAKDSFGNWIWNTGITPEGINASLLRAGQIDTNLVRIFAGNNVRLQLNSDGLIAYRALVNGDSNPDEYVIHNSEGLFLVNDEINRVEVSWNGLIIRNNLNESVFYADAEGNLTLAGYINALGGSIGGWTIEDNKLVSENEQTGLASSGEDTPYPAFWAGKNGVTTKFLVMSDGTLTASGVTIEGIINATGGKLGNLTIQEVENSLIGVHILIPQGQNFKYESTAAEEYEVINEELPFSTDVKGIIPTSYQWAKSKDYVSWTNLGTQSSYIFPYTEMTFNGTKYDVVYLRCTISDGTDSYSDIITLYNVYDGYKGNDGASGVDGLAALTTIITNSTHTFPASNGGVVSSYVGGGTDIRIFEGIAELEWTSDTVGNGQYSISTTPTNITIGSISKPGGTVFARFSDPSNFSAGSDTASIVYNITGKRSNGDAFSFSLIQTFSKSKQGTQGIQGNPGADGQPNYTWIKYSDYDDGTDLYDVPTDNTKYIGIATNKTTATESTVKTDYTWSRFRGEDGTDGIPGQDGADGQTTYTWIRYADDASGSGISNSPTGKSYIGFAYNKTTATESDNPLDYKWSLIKGADGESAYTVLLTNESHTFPGDISNALTGSTSFNILAFKGATQIAATIGTIQGGIAGAISTTINNNGTTNASVTVNVTTNLVAAGTLTIPITVDGKSFSKTFSYTISFKGVAGVDGTPGIDAKLVTLTASGQIFRVPATGSISPTTITVIGNTQNTSITTWEYSVDGGSFSQTVPTGVNRVGSTVTITGATITATSIVIRASDGTYSDTITIVKVIDGVDGEDGAPAPLLYLASSAVTMSFDANNTPNPASQVIALEAKLQNISGTVTWEAKKYAGDSLEGDATLGGSGNNRTIAQSQFGVNTTRIVVTITLGALSDTVTIVKLKNGATGADSYRYWLEFVSNAYYKFVNNLNNEAYVTEYLYSPVNIDFNAYTSVGQTGAAQNVLGISGFAAKAYYLYENNWVEITDEDVFVVNTSTGACSLKLGLMDSTYANWDKTAIKFVLLYNSTTLYQEIKTLSWGTSEQAAKFDFTVSGAYWTTEYLNYLFDSDGLRIRNRPILEAAYTDEDEVYHPPVLSEDIEDIFYVSNSGSVFVKGNIFASTGQIGRWTIDENGIFAIYDDGMIDVPESEVSVSYQAALVSGLSSIYYTDYTDVDAIAYFTAMGYIIMPETAALAKQYSVGTEPVLYTGILEKGRRSIIRDKDGLETSFLSDRTYTFTVLSDGTVYAKNIILDGSFYGNKIVLDNRLSITKENIENYHVLSATSTIKTRYPLSRGTDGNYTLKDVLFGVRKDITNELFPYVFTLTADGEMLGYQGLITLGSKGLTVGSYKEIEPQNNKLYYMANGFYIGLDLDKSKPLLWAGRFVDTPDSGIEDVNLNNTNLDNTYFYVGADGSTNIARLIVKEFNLERLVTNEIHVSKKAGNTNNLLLVESEGFAALYVTHDGITNISNLMSQKAVFGTEQNGILIETTDDNRTIASGQQNGVQSWYANNEGEASFKRLIATEISTAVFSKERINAVNGALAVMNTARLENFEALEDDMCLITCDEYYTLQRGDLIGYEKNNQKLMFLVLESTENPHEYMCLQLNTYDLDNNLILYTPDSNDLLKIYGSPQFEIFIVSYSYNNLTNVHTIVATPRTNTILTNLDKINNELEGEFYWSIFGDEIISLSHDGEEITFEFISESPYDNLSIVGTAVVLQLINSETGYFQNYGSIHLRANTNSPEILLYKAVNLGDLDTVNQILLKDTTSLAVKIGDLSNLYDENFGQLSGYGLYSENAYLKGSLFLPGAGITNNKTLNFSYDLWNASNLGQSSINESSSVRFWAGTTGGEIGRAPFVVTENGVVYASRGIFKGEVYAEKGTFSGTISSSGILVNRFGGLFIAAKKEESDTYDPREYIINFSSENGIEIYDGGFGIFRGEERQGNEKNNFYKEWLGSTDEAYPYQFPYASVIESSQKFVSYKNEILQFEPKIDENEKLWYSFKGMSLDPSELRWYESLADTPLFEVGMTNIEGWKTHYQNAILKERQDQLFNIKVKKNEIILQDELSYKNGELNFAGSVILTMIPGSDAGFNFTVI